MQHSHQRESIHRTSGSGSTLRLSSQQLRFHPPLESLSHRRHDRSEMSRRGLPARFLHSYDREPRVYTGRLLASSPTDSWRGSSCVFSFLPCPGRSGGLQSRWSSHRDAHRTLIIGDSPMHDDIRVIVRHSSAEFHIELIHVPFLRGWTKRFKNLGTGLT